MTLKEAIKYVKESSLSEGIVPSADIILDTATRIFISQNISQSKRDNIKAIQNQPVPQAKSGDTNRGKELERNKPPFSSGATPPSPDNPPSIKQLNLLRKLGVSESELPTTKKEAWQMISSIKNQQEGY